MHELAFFGLGLFVGSLATFGLMAIGKAAKDADRWGQELSDYAAEGEVYDFTKDAARPFDDVGYRIRKIGDPTQRTVTGQHDETQIWP